MRIKLTLTHVLFSLVLFCSSYGQNNNDRTLFLLMDTSLSMKDKNIEKEWQFIQSLTRDFESIMLIPFANTIHEKKTFSLDDAGLSSLKAYLNELNYDGAAYLPRGLDLLNAGEIWLFSDGNFLNETLPFTRKTPIHVVSSLPASDLTQINRILSETGGKFYDLNAPDAQEKGKSFIDETEVKNKVRFRVSGVVNSPVGPITNASIINLNTAEGTNSAQNGFYELDAAVGDTLSFSGLGYKTKTFLIGSSNRTVNMKLEERLYELEGVDVVAEKKEAEKTGSTVITQKSKGFSQRVLSKDDFNTNAVYLADLIRGKFAGVRVEGFGADARIFMRSTLSLGNAGDETPLYVIDGTPFTSYPDFLSVNTIENISVDTSLGAGNRFGNLGRNGVIYITTIAGLRAANNSQPDTLLNKEVYRFDALPYQDLAPAQPFYIAEILQAPDALSAYNTYLTNRKYHIENYNFFIRVAEALYQKGFKKEALLVASNIFENFQENPVALRSLALFFMSKQEFYKAAEAYKILTKNNNPAIDAYLGLADIALIQKDWNEALELLEFLVNTYNFENIEYRQIISNKLKYILENQPDALISDSLSAFVVTDNYQAYFVLEWNNPDIDFEVEFVNPSNIVYALKLAVGDSLVNQRKKWLFTSKDFFLQNSPLGKWLVNITYKGSVSSDDTVFYLTYFNPDGLAHRKDLYLPINFEGIKVKVLEIDLR